MKCPEKPSKKVKGTESFHYKEIYQKIRKSALYIPTYYMSRNNLSYHLSKKTTKKKLSTRNAQLILILYVAPWQFRPYHKEGWFIQIVISLYEAYQFNWSNTCGKKKEYKVQLFFRLARYSLFSTRDVLFLSKIIGIELKCYKNYLKVSLVKILSSVLVGSVWISLPRDLLRILPFKWIIVGFKLNIYFGSIP